MKKSRNSYFKIILLVCLQLLAAKTYAQDPDVCGVEYPGWTVADLDFDLADGEDAGTYPSIVYSWCFGG